MPQDIRKKSYMSYKKYIAETIGTKIQSSLLQIINRIDKGNIKRDKFWLNVCRFATHLERIWIFNTTQSAFKNETSSLKIRHPIWNYASRKVYG